MTQTALKNYKQQSGFSLLEVLISLVVLSIGLIGMAGIQQAGVRNNHNALLHSQASMLAYEITDMMRSNAAAVELGRYSRSTSPGNLHSCATTETSAATNCTVDQIRDFHLTTWYDNLAKRLPQGTGAISCQDSNTADAFPCTPGSILTIDVSWVETDIGGAEQMTFLTEVQL